MEELDKGVTNASKAMNSGLAYFSSNLIDACLDKLRNSALANFLVNSLSGFTKAGLYGLYVSAILGLIYSVLIADAHKSIGFGLGISVGLGFAFCCIVLHYLAAKFLPNIIAILRVSPTSMNSNAFLDGYAFLFILLGLASSAACFYFAIEDKNYYFIMYGLFSLFACANLAVACLKPSELNISIDESANAAEEVLGLFSLFTKIFLKFAPIAFFSSVFAGLAHLISMPFQDYSINALNNIYTDIKFIALFFSFALSPIVTYVSYIISFFFIDMAIAVLSLKKKGNS